MVLFFLRRGLFAQHLAISFASAFVGKPLQLNPIGLYIPAKTFQVRESPIEFHYFRDSGVAGQDIRNGLSFARGDSAFCNGRRDVLEKDWQILGASNGTQLEIDAALLARRDDPLKAQAQGVDIAFLGHCHKFSGQLLGFAFEQLLACQGGFVAAPGGPSGWVAASAILKCSV